MNYNGFNIRADSILAVFYPNLSKFESLSNPPKKKKTHRKTSLSNTGNWAQQPVHRLSPSRLEGVLELPAQTSSVLSLHSFLLWKNGIFAG